MSDVLPQHDLDERKRLGREIGIENARRAQRNVAGLTADQVQQLVEQAYGLGWDDCFFGHAPRPPRMR